MPPETGDTGLVVKDPRRGRFWTIRNIAGLVLLAALPVMGTQVWNFFTHYAALATRVKDLETEQANNKAIWTAITDLQNKNTEREIDHRTTMRIFEREFGDPMRLRAYAAGPEPDPVALEDIRKLLEEMAKRYHEDHPDTEKLPDVPPTLVQEPPVQQVQRPVTPQQVPNQIDPETFRQLYEKRFPKQKK